MTANRRSLSFPDRAQWRAWLQGNHEVSTGVWLALRGKASGLSSAEAVEEALCFGWMDSLVTRMEGEAHCRLFTPRHPGSEWSESDREKAVDLIARGLITEAGMEQVRLARDRGLWYSKPPRGLTMPAELEEALENSPKAALFFAELEPSFRRGYMAHVASGDSVETRRSRAAEAVFLLEREKKQAPVAPGKSEERGG